MRRRRKRVRLGVRILTWAGVVLGGLVIGLPLLTVFALRWIPPPVSAMMIEKRVAAWNAKEQDYHLRYRWVGWDDISPHVRIAVVAAEDQKFPQHAGFDREAIEDAWQDHQRGRRLRGASTISQQVAKNLFLWPGRSFVRKGLEAYFTVLLESLWPKRRILEVYLNIAEFGRGIFGVRAASEQFFGKPPRGLDRAEAALLAAVLPNPLRLHADRPSPYVRERAGWIRGQMDHLGGVEYLKELE
jgi:monofunctional biosynthetic peptidoglycan transglycosylase